MMPMAEISLIRTRQELRQLIPEWTRLFYDSAPPNPFAHPEWMSTWAKHYVASDQLYVAAARHHGELVGVVPLYLQRHRVGPKLVVSARLLGTGSDERITELPQILIHPHARRNTLSSLMRFLAKQEGEWDWLEFILTPDQGWPYWVGGGLDPDVSIVHKATRRCVVLPLPKTWHELRAGLKRNVKESIRRGVNRLSRGGHVWDIVDVIDESLDLESALSQLALLHRMRAQMPEKIEHPNYLAGRHEAFYRDAVRRMFEAGHAVPTFLRVDGIPVAGRLILQANGAVFYSLSGLDPNWWWHNTPTTLMAESLRRAIERGGTVANLSLGPDVSKLRWSEQLEMHEEFVMIGNRLRSRLAFSLFWQLRAADLLRRSRIQARIRAIAHLAQNEPRRTHARRSEPE